MADLRDRLVAYGTRPDVYDAPTPQQCLSIADDMKRLRWQADIAEEYARELAAAKERLFGKQGNPNG